MSDQPSKEMMEAAARRLAYDEWPLAPEDERCKWVQWHWQGWQTKARNALVAALQASPAPETDEQRSLREAAERLRRRSPAAADRPVAWSYDLASYYDRTTKEWSVWHSHITSYEPNVARGSVRNLQPLYAAPAVDRAEVAELRAALKPFADLARGYEDREDQINFAKDEWHLSDTGNLTVGDVRRAAAAIRGISEFTGLANTDRDGNVGTFFPEAGKKEDYDSEAFLAAGKRLLPHSIAQAGRIMGLTPRDAGKKEEGK